MHIFIPAESQSAAKLSNARWKPDSVEAESNHQQITGKSDFAIFDHGALISLATFVIPIHVNNEEERKQNTP